ncbi:unnamed protein product, partial [Symbiodinium pilosum]
FQCSKVVTDAEDSDGDDTPRKQKVKKVLVKWDIEPEEMVQDINELRGFRMVMTDLGGPEREVVRVKSDASHLSRVSDRKSTQRSLQQLENVFGEPDSDEEHEEASLQPVSPAEVQAVQEEEVRLDIDEAGALKVQAYEHGEAVLYFSASQNCFIPAVIEGRGSFDDDGLPLYSVIVGRGKQLRTPVPMQLLRAPLAPGIRVEVFSEA